MKYIVFIIALFFNPYTVSSQTSESGKDSTAFLDSIFKDMDDILDQLMPSKSSLSVSAGAGTGLYNFRDAGSQFTTEKKLLLSPAIAYLHKSGLGFTAAGYLVSDRNDLLPYQLSLAPSYDYIRKGKWATGIAYTRYFTKKDLSFYTTPITNDIYAYYNYKKWWIQPTIALSYGWGSRNQTQQKESDLLILRRRLNPGLITINKNEAVSDFSSMISLRHHFTFIRLFSKKDMFGLSPVLVLNAGTQNFGFNTTYQTRHAALNKFLPFSQYISGKKEFDVQSASVVLRLDYSINKFFMQSQFLLDYFLHPAEKRVNNAVAVIAGVNL